LPKCSSGWDQPLGRCAGIFAKIGGIALHFDLSFPQISFLALFSLLKKNILDIFFSKFTNNNFYL